MKSNQWTKMSRQEFLDWRARRTADAVEFSKTQKPSEEFMIVMDAGDDIICDVCNCDVEGDELFMNSWGLYCSECKEKHT